MLKKLMNFALAAALMLGVVGAATTEADAGYRNRIGVGIAAGVVAGTVFGAYAYGAPRYAYRQPSYVYSSGGGCYAGPRQCEWVGQRCWINRFGERACGGAEQRCWRTRICD
jgi:hypothetical protein